MLDITDIYIWEALFSSWKDKYHMKNTMELTLSVKINAEAFQM